MLRFATLLLLAVSAAGCNIVYKQNIHQGNVLDPEDLEQLEPGMTKRQVMLLLGSPAVRNPFHDNRWDYINSLALRGGKPTRLTLTVLFENDRVAEFSGNYLESNEITGQDLEKLEIIDPNTNQPVLPPTDDQSPAPEDQNPPGS